jgi:hypothetical protein
MRLKRLFKQRGRMLALSAFLVFLVLFAAWLAADARRPVLRIRVDETGEILREAPVRTGDELFVGWTHSQEKIPWNEWYTVEADGTLTLDTISFPAFGPGIPCDKGTPRIKDGTIYYEGIGESFPSFRWLNSAFTREIRLNGDLIARGEILPDHTILTLTIERKKLFHGR